MNVSLLVTGRMYHTAESLPDTWELAEGATLDTLLEQINVRLEAPLPDSCLIAVAGEHVGTVAHHDNPALRDGDDVVLISPVAGGA